MMEGYANEDWNLLQHELKDLFRQHDTNEFSMAALHGLVKNGASLDLNIYVLKHLAISKVLVRNRRLTAWKRVHSLLDGLPRELREQAMEFCIKRGWKLLETDEDDETDFSVYDKVKKFLIDEWRFMQTMAALEKCIPE